MSHGRVCCGSNPCRIKTTIYKLPQRTGFIIWQGSPIYLGICRWVPKSVRSGSLNLVAKMQELNEAGTHPTATLGQLFALGRALELTDLVR